jgi:EF hand
MSALWITRNRLVFGALVVIWLGGCAGSNHPDIPVADKGFLGGIASYDKNGDSVVTCDEWRAAALQLFTRADTTGAGVLTEAEFQSLAKIDRTFESAGFKLFDANHDGKVDKKEFVDRPNPAFAFADKDKDCRLSTLELQTARNLSDPPPPPSSASATSAAPGPNVPGR